MDEDHHIIRREEVYPPPQFVTDDPALKIPFPLLCGEHPEFLGQTKEGLITVTNFRILVCEKNKFFNVPIFLVEAAEILETVYIRLSLKDGTTVKFMFATNFDCNRWMTRISSKIGVPKDLKVIFAFPFYFMSKGALENDCSDSCKDDSVQLIKPLKEGFAYTFGKEAERMRFNFTKKGHWRITHFNEHYKYCETYPKQHVVPSAINDDFLQKAARYRAGGRFPSVVWRDQRNGAVIVRSSQPSNGLMNWRCEEDEALIKAIVQACALDSACPSPSSRRKQQELSPAKVDAAEGGAQGPVEVTNGHAASVANGDMMEGTNGHAAESETQTDAPVLQNLPKRLLIIDCRSYTAAFCNNLMGGGHESKEYYDCDIVFMEMGNIHSVRQSFQKLRFLCATFPDASFTRNLESTGWLSLLSSILKSALHVVDAVDKQARPVLIHCSDGWDRTPQLVSLACIMLDPYYRTMEGFQCLVEREWVSFGHKFAERSGHAVDKVDSNQRSPIFQQFLDCVYQMTLQYPLEFEFNEAYLVKLVQHTYSCLFGNFLFDRESERVKQEKLTPTASVWALLNPNNKQFCNMMYKPKPENFVMRVDYGLHVLALWRSVYMCNLSSYTSTREFSMEPGLTKSKSADNVTRHAGEAVRRNSDSSLDTAILAAMVESGHEVAVPEPAPGVPISSAKMEGAGDILSADMETCKVSEVADSGPGGKPETVTESTQCDSLIANSDEDGVSNSNDACPNENGGKDDDVSVTDCKKIQDSQQSSKEKVPLFVSDRDCRQLMNSDSKEENGHDSSLSILHSQKNKASKGEVPPIPVASETRGDSAFCDSDEKCHQSTVYSSMEESPDSGMPEVYNEHPACPPSPSIQSSTDTLTADESEPCLDESTNETSSPLPISADKQKGGGADAGKSQPMSRSFEAERELIPSGSVYHTVHGVTAGSFKDAARMRYPSGTIFDRRADFQGGPLKLSIDRPSVSTSTTDISDSCVQPAGLAPGVQTLVANWMDSAASEVASPESNSPAVNSDGKVLENPLTRQLNSVEQYLDVDGLTSFNDSVQERVREIVAKEHSKYNKLLAEYLSMRAKIELYLQANRAGGNGIHALPTEDIMSLESDGEMSSLGAVSNAASDASWEQVDDADSRMVLWVPDHAVTHCAQCDALFWLGCRKHHCRNCGKVFCAKCSDYLAPVPRQHLMEPVRVCRRCHATLLQLSPGASSDGRIATLVADG